MILVIIIIVWVIVWDILFVKYCILNNSGLLIIFVSKLISNMLMKNLN